MTNGETDLLHASLRDSWGLCEAVRRDLLSALNAAAEGWNAPPKRGRWTVAQHADHLLRAETGTSKMARRLIRGDYAGVSVPEGVRRHDSTLSVYPFGPADAPQILEPVARDPHQTLEGLAAAHRRFHEELRRFRGEDPDTLVAPDPASGDWFTLAGWVRVQALHEGHHLAQIREVLAAAR